ncbi:MAG: heme exporter protein CcmD [Gammaproteobacteria bacterium]|nr:MAG: heme exporter protein CcmD [Gammaproteobacteria bacterium]PIE36282.1 MAG: heme exporter protein CcmD [Gammaproteobacteria bacterium]
MNTFADFLSMGGRGFYVWSAYAFTFLFLLVVVLWAARARTRTRTRVLSRARQRPPVNRKRKTSGDKIP